MTPHVERLGLVAAGALAGALSTFIVMRLVFTPAPLPPPLPPAVEPPGDLGELLVFAISSGETSPPIFVDRVEKQAGRTREALPAGTYQVKVVCPADSPNPGWAPVKSIIIEAGQRGGFFLSCDHKAIEPL